jgi:methylated-DNA-protein-cysteine methyltransferase-like protein
MKPGDDRFKRAVHEIVRLIPQGRVMTYGQIATLLGAPRAAQAVGWTAHWGDPEVPWQRVVNRHGRVAPGWPGGMAAHAAELRAEGLEVRADMTVDLDRYLWEPSEKQLARIGNPAIRADI